MTGIPYYIVDVFTDHPFGGNPAGVCLLDAPMVSKAMQEIAAENRLSETAFLVRRGAGSYDLRWFTPEVEIDLCGHATLGSAFVLMNFVDPAMTRVEFHTMSGLLTVGREGERYVMDFPRREPAPCAVPVGLEDALGVKVLETHQSRDLLVLLADETEVAGLEPDGALLGRVSDAFGIVVTARGTDCDLVSRYFAPNAGILEDPATGSSHCTLIPFWSARLGKRHMTSRQLSRRGGTFTCEDGDGRVRIGGTAVLYLGGTIVGR